MADGDGRALLNLIEQVAAWSVEGCLDRDALATPFDAPGGAIRQSGRLRITT